MSYAQWYIRWQIVRALVALAFWIAPTSAARTIFLGALNEASKDIMMAVNDRRA